MLVAKERQLKDSMSQFDFINLFYALIAIAYLVLVIVAIRSQGFADRTIRLLLSYAVFSILWEISLIIGRIRGDQLFSENTLARLPVIGLFLLALVFLHLTVSFLRRKSLSWIWWLVGGFWLVEVAVFELNFVQIKDILFRGDGWIVTRQGFSLGSLLVGWGVFMAAALITLVRMYRQTKRISTRSRIAYWALGLVLTIGGDILFWVQSVSFLGSLFRIVGLITVAHIILTHRLPDLRLTLRMLVSGTIVIAVELTLYTLGFVTFQHYFDTLSSISPLSIGLLLALVLLLLFNPLMQLIRKVVNRLILGDVHDPTRILREFSQSISNILDLKLLATVVVSLVSEVFEVQHGALFIVDSESGVDGGKRYRVKGAQGMGSEDAMPGLIAEDSPIAEVLGSERRALTQAEIDMSPKFRYLGGNERSWISHQDFDIYVPIHAKDDWVGILALGPKVSGASYFDDDLEFLATLSDQTAVALQNARLVESLVRINNEFRRAYSAMEEAHTKLERIDRTKSDFISIASHELRTPLTVLGGYSQMLLDDPSFSENAYYQKIVSGIHDGTTRLHEIVDSMLEVAKIDTRALELKSEPVEISDVLEKVCRGFNKVLAERNLTLELEPLGDLPAVYGDVEALRKVFYHLIINAIKYTPDNGSITITGNALSEGEDVFPQGGVEIIVSDTGIGIDPRFKDLIFAKFYQTGELSLHSSGKTKFKGGGPGLGLAIVRGIVQGHGGKVWVESPGYDEESNPGSQFHVILPVAREHQPDSFPPIDIL
jgi:signal transduction histidine kinase